MYTHMRLYVATGLRILYILYKNILIHSGDRHVDVYTNSCSSTHNTFVQPLLCLNVTGRQHARRESGKPGTDRGGSSNRGGRKSGSAPKYRAKETPNEPNECKIQIHGSAIVLLKPPIHRG